MTLLAYFTIAFVLSALGSVPTGMITLTIMQTTIQKGSKSGVIFSLGATVIEWLYTYIALFFLDFFTNNIQVDGYFKIIATVVFFLLGAFHFFKKNKPETPIQLNYQYFDFLHGISIAMMNVLIIPFWIFLAIWLAGYEMLFTTQPQLLIFSTGSAIGALVIFLIYVRLGKLMVGKIKRVKEYSGKAVGLVFFALGVYQLFQLL